MNDPPISAQENQMDTKNIFKALGNPLRIEILSQLATGDKFVLQLVKTLGFSQQDIHRNLNYLEKLGIVRSYSLSYHEYKDDQTKPSKGRKYFAIDQSFMLQINLSPTFFKISSKKIPLEHLEFENSEFAGDIDSTLMKTQDKSINELSYQLWEENERLDELIQQQYVIFFNQNLILKHIIEKVNKLGLNPIQSLVMIKMLESPTIKIEDLALELSLNTTKLEEILISLTKHVPMKNQKGIWSIEQ
jgi:predicted transcriptional regulator